MRSKQEIDDPHYQGMTVLILARYNCAKRRFSYEEVSRGSTMVVPQPLCDLARSWHRLQLFYRLRAHAGLVNHSFLRHQRLPLYLPRLQCVNLFQFKLYTDSDSLICA